MVALQTTIHDGTVTLFGDTLLGDLLVNPIGETPHVGANLAELDSAGSVVLDGGLEVVVKVSIV